MDIGIINFIGIRRFVYQTTDNHGPVVRIVGGNAQGKSSVLLALAACITQNNNPRKVNKTRMGAYGHNAAPNVRASLKLGEHWRVDIIPGQSHAATITKGFEINPEIAKVVAGLSDTTKWGQKDYVKIFDEVSITESAFIGAVFGGMADWSLDNVNNPESPEHKAAAEAYRRMKEMGVEGAIEHYKSQARDRKADWRNAVAQAGESLAYGKKVAANWTPEGWLDEWEHLSIEDVQQELSAAQKTADEAKMIVAYDEGKLANLRELAGQCDALGQKRIDAEAVFNTKKQYREKAHQFLDGMSKKLEDAKKQLADLRHQHKFYSEKPPEIDCPHCGKGVVVQTTSNGHKLASPDAYDNSKKLVKICEEGNATKALIEGLEPQVAKAREARDKHDADYAKAREDFVEVRDKHDAAMRAVNELSAADKGESEDVRAKKIAAAENALSTARDKYAKVLCYHKAKAAHKAVERSANIAATMEPGGTVSAKLSETGMGLLDKWMDFISNFFGYKVRIENGTTLFGKNERIAGLNCSESEDWICRTITQIAMGCAFGNRMPVLIDRVDVLDDRQLTAFLANLQKYPGNIQSAPPLIIAGTKRPGVYDESTADVVIEDGVVVQNKAAGA